MLPSSDSRRVALQINNMSAIFGIFQRQERANIPTVIKASQTAMTAYGLDNRGQWSDELVGLGYQGMTVSSEVEREKLPQYDTNARLAITADVRLDNREELSAMLNISLPQQNNLSDSDLILQAYRKWNHHCTQYLLGDFAFAIWDANARTMFCARDHIGAKPLYYSLTPERFVFASDIEGVLAVPGVPDELDEASVAAKLLDYSFYGSERTFLQAVRKLPPAHTLTVSVDADRLERYWFPDRLPEVRFSSDEDYVEAFLEIYKQAVKDRLRTVHSVGVHLSGGLDSSSVAVLAARELREQGKPAPTAFCWQPPPNGEPSSNSEHHLIKIVCAQEQLIPHYQNLTAHDILAVLQRDPTREPITSTLFHEQLVQQQAASQGIQVILSGWGGDEGIAFNGRGYYSELLLKGKWLRLYQESLARYDNPWKFIVLQAIVPLVPNGDRLLKQIRGKWRDPKPYINPDFARRVKSVPSNPYGEVGVRQTQLLLLNYGHLTERIEDWAASGARRNLIYCYPLLDRRVMEFALGLPPEQFRRGKWNRWLMRNAVSKLLPSEVCWNSSKLDPIRLERYSTGFTEALKLLGQCLANPSNMPSRAVYLDMSRLMQQLTPEAIESSHIIELAYLTFALQFLDW